MTNQRTVFLPKIFFSSQKWHIILFQALKLHLFLLFSIFFTITDSSSAVWLVTFMQVYTTNSAYPQKKTTVWTDNSGDKKYLLSLYDKIMIRLDYVNKGWQMSEVVGWLDGWIDTELRWTFVTAIDNSLPVYNPDVFCFGIYCYHDVKGWRAYRKWWI